MSNIYRNTISYRATTGPLWPLQKYSGLEGRTADSAGEQSGSGPVAGRGEQFQADDSSATQDPQRARGDGERGGRLHWRR